MKQSPLSVKIIKFLFLIIGISLIIKSEALNEFQAYFNQKECYLGCLFILIAIFKRLRKELKE